MSAGIATSRARGTSGKVRRKKASAQDASSLDSLAMYRREISPIPLLSPAEERDLLVAAKGGDQEAVSKLVSANLKFVWRKAREMVARGCQIPLQELISEGNLGLFDAVERFDLSRDVRFLTYADAWVRLRMEEAVSSLAGPVRVPQDRRVEMRKYAAAVSTLADKMGRTPTDEEVAEEMGVSMITLRGIQAAPWMIYDFDASVNSAPHEGGEVAGTRSADGIAEFLPTEDISVAVSDKLRNAALVETLEKILEPREFAVIVRYFGLDGQEPQTLTEIAELIPRGMTREEKAKGMYLRRTHLGRERVRGLRNSAIQKIMANPQIVQMAEDFLRGGE